MEECVFPTRTKKYKFQKGDNVCVKNYGNVGDISKGVFVGQAMINDYAGVDRLELYVNIDGNVASFRESEVGKMELVPSKPGGRRRKTKQRKIKRKKTRRAAR